MVIEPEQSITDRELVARFQSTRDQSAFETLVARHSGHAYQIAYSFLNSKEDAEEVVQDAFVRIYRNLMNFRGDAEFTTWMYRIVTNLCNNKYRWNKVRSIGKNISIDAPLETSASSGSGSLKLDLPDDRMQPDKQVAFNELREKLDKAMAELPESYREAVMLRNVQDLDYEQIAAMLNCAVGTVKSRINRGRELLRQALDL